MGAVGEKYPLHRRYDLRIKLYLLKLNTQNSHKYIPTICKIFLQMTLKKLTTPRFR